MHFAIVHHDMEMLKLLVSNGANTRTPHASGDFFYTNEQLYFGGTLLGFAACLDDKQIVDYLMANHFCKVGPLVGRVAVGNGWGCWRGVPAMAL